MPNPCWRKYEMRRFAVACVFGLLWTTALHADTIEVPLGGDIQAAIDGASDGDIIQLAAGTYNAYQISPGGRAITIQGSLHEDGSLATTIDAQQQGGPVIRINSGEDDGTVIKELVITGGQGNVGSGITCDSGTSPVIMGCRISGNYGGFAAGGIDCFESSPTIIDCEITNSLQGTGLVLTDSDVTLGSTTVCGNNSSELFVDDDSTLIPLGGNCISDDCTDTDGCADCSDLDGDGLCDDVDPCPTWPGGCSGDGDRVLVIATDQSIQDAIDLVADGGTVEIIAGTFSITSTIDPGGKALTILGAVDGDGAPTTVLDGGGSVRVLICQNDETEETVFENLLIQNGSASGSSFDGRGGGMYITGNPTLANCTFSNNQARFGGGLYNRSSSSPTLTDCTFTGNAADEDGGGLFNYSSNPALDNCTFTGNTAGEGGGGMFSRSLSSPTLLDCTFSGNTASDFGGGICANDSSMDLDECTFSGNTSSSRGGGIFADDSSADLTGCTFDGNSASTGGGMYITGGSSTLSACMFTTNSAVGGSDASGAQPGGGGAVFTVHGYTDALFNDCTFTGNSAMYGGVLYNGFVGGGFLNDSSPTLVDCTLSGNTATQSGGGVYTEDASFVVLEGAIICGNTVDGAATDENQVEGDYTETGVNCITAECTDTDYDGIPDCSMLCVEDINGDGEVDGADLAYVLGYWGTDDPLGDVNLDGIVDSADIGLVLAAWGPCPN